jgi:hypothetical protein
MADQLQPRIKIVMRMCQSAVGAIAFAGMMMFANAAQAVTVQECSAKYKSAHADGSLKGMKYSEYRKTECGIETPMAHASPAAKRSAPAPVAGFASPWGAPLPGTTRPD